MDWSNEATTVQEAWDDFETKLIPIVDSIIPMSSFYNNVNSKRPSCSIQRKRTLRKRLLKTFKWNPTLDLKNRIKNLNIEIKTYFYAEKRSNVRRNLIPGSQ